jgi:hypothetical protein
MRIGRIIVGECRYPFFNGCERATETETTRRRRPQGEDDDE